MKKYKITGNDLIKLGFKPSKWFGDALSFLNLNETPIEDIYEVAKTFIPVEPEKIKPFEIPVEYYKNIETDTKDEIENLVQLEKTMQELMKTPTVLTGALMPDACPTGELGQIPVGGVVVTDKAIHPSMHSADVCCSVYATNFGKVNPADVLKVAAQTTQFGAGGRKGYTKWCSYLDDNKDLTEAILSNYYTKDYIEKARLHLGTQGDGNHFLFVGVSSETGDTWMVTHHGSRGFGASVYKKGMHEAEKFRRKLSPDTLKRNAWIPYTEIEGQLYWEALQIVREWTKLNHSSIHNQVLNKLSLSAVDTFWNEHNFVFKDSEDKFYHAKGATPLSNEFVPDSYCGRRLIPLNMAQPILVVKGETTENNLGFAPHGAGRNISRSEHKRRLDAKGLSVQDVLEEETEGLEVIFYSGKPDTSELPSAYKNAEQVKEGIKKFGLGEIVDEIMPYGCIMAGEQEFNWKK